MSEQAEARDVSCQSLIKVWLREKLRPGKAKPRFDVVLAIALLLTILFRARNVCGPVFPSLGGGTPCGKSFVSYSRFWRRC